MRLCNQCRTVYKRRAPILTIHAIRLHPVLRDVVRCWFLLERMPQRLGAARCVLPMPSINSERADCVERLLVPVRRWVLHHKRHAVHQRHHSHACAAATPASSRQHAADTRRDGGHAGRVFRDARDRHRGDGAHAADPAWNPDRKNRFCKGPYQSCIKKLPSVPVSCA